MIKIEKENENKKKTRKINKDTGSTELNLMNISGQLNKIRMLVIPSVTLQKQRKTRKV